MSVAKPWIVLLPAPLTSHSLAGLPGLVFSHATGFVIGASHGAAAAGAAPMTRVRARLPRPAASQAEDPRGDAHRGRSYAPLCDSALVERGVLASPLG